MADDKRGREKQARNADDRQRQRDVEAALARGDELEPPVEPEELTALERELETLEFPATGAEVVSAVGDEAVESPTGTYTIEELIPATDEETYDAPDAVRVRVERPTVAAAMKRVVEASKTLPKADLYGSRRDAYVKTFEELAAIEADDDDEGITTVSDWIEERIREKEKLPSSRDVRRRAAKFCRNNGHAVRNDEWLGV